MVFSSVIFLIWFLPVFLLLYFIVPQVFKNYVALAGSLFFYAWGGPLFVFILLGTITIDYALAIHMHGAPKREKKYLVGFSIVLNLSFLVYAKYSDFFIDNFNAILGTEVPLLNVVLPIGISFFTFQKLSYIIDVYRGREPQQNWANFALYILLFPQLIAGPIVRYKDIADQLTNRSIRDTIDDKIMGLYRFILGLSKKVLLANYFGYYADEYFHWHAEFYLGETTMAMPWWAAWIGILAYTFQIYFDFSGYSDMAIGIGRMLGFKFPENFNFPYIAQNITEFWRRWHITLSNWMRDYLYIPLGGNRVSEQRLYVNLAVVFLISGFWHGAAWVFIIWGAWHGLFLILDRLFLKDALKKLGKVPSIMVTFFIVVIGWVFFRSINMEFATDYLLTMFGGGNVPLHEIDSFLWPDFKMVFMFALAFIFSFIGAHQKLETWLTSEQLWKNRLLPFLGMSAGCLLLFGMCVMKISAQGFNPFIYFRF